MLLLKDLKGTKMVASIMSSLNSVIWLLQKPSQRMIMDQAPPTLIVAVVPDMVLLPLF